MTDTTRYPAIEVQLSGEDGNVFAILGRVTGALRRAGVSAEERSEYTAEMMKAASYDDALRITMNWVRWS